MGKYEKYDDLYYGQTKSDYLKTIKRIKDIVSKSDGDIEKMKSLAKQIV